MKERNQTLRKKVFERDNFTCQKCKIQDETTKILEVHHINPLFMEGNDNLDNLITLCSDCHHFAPNNKQEFEDYMGEEMDRTFTTLMKAWKKVREEQKF
ncbi:MAG: HNH endonuclease [Candidatus Pacearchaeota archaeon]|nr:HNH endonuclease [Candidatus Pacearchaeota archaeon]